MLKEEYLIGREDANRADILINNDTVSGLHAKIWYEESTGNFWIKDLQSFNGTYIIRDREFFKINNSSKIFPNDTIRFGNYEILFSQLLKSLESKGEQKRIKQHLKLVRKSSINKMQRCINCGSPKIINRPCSKCSKEESKRWMDY